jgi:tripartite-type tricarboxylate transporter receptor subunit TctC
MGLFSPAGLPPQVQSALSEDVQRALRSPQLNAELSRAGFQVVGGSAEEFRQFMEAEFARWNKAARQSGMHVKAPGGSSKALR